MKYNIKRTLLLVAFFIGYTKSFPLESENEIADERFFIDLESLGSDLYGTRNPSVGKL